MLWNLSNKKTVEHIISNEDYLIKQRKIEGRKPRRLSMHCVNKNYTDLSKDNWVCVCEFGCHQGLDKPK